ncbi:GNAT family N-acetyltransferase [Alistipes sp.]|uniref:GNAT family N-acetyltransferase n=1 Tax=Alistipes sp. TaxID=1872444 RepID=UPI0025B990D7|nr:GNAT family N-acetyltransferase [Alistipes sp.]
MKHTPTATRILPETERLRLRRMELSDMQALSDILCDERVMYAYEGAFDQEQVAAWMQKQLRRYEEHGFGLWAVVSRQTGEMIGQCGITMQEYAQRQVPEIGYLFAYRHWHRGYATEAAAACREYGFRTLGFDALYSIIRDTNVASQRVALRNGMLPVDTIVKHYRGVDMPHIVFRTRSGEAPAADTPPVLACRPVR